MMRSLKKTDRRAVTGRNGGLWLLTFPGAIWAAHFLVSYVATAVICARFSELPQAVPLLRLGLAGVTLLALGGIACIGWRSWRQWDFLDDYDHVHNLPVDEHRREFLGHVAFLLSVISFVGVAYVALPVAFLETCQ